MANIPVEKKGGFPWWLLLLGLLLLAALAFLFIDGDDDEMAEPVAVEEVEEPPMATDMTTGPITDLSTILTSSSPSEFVGRDVRLSGVTARAVSGDSTYWIYNPDEGVERSVFVVLRGLGESEAGPGTGADGRYNVDEGETMLVEGEVVRVEASDPDAWGVTGADNQRLREGQVYIRATQLRNL